MCVGVLVTQWKHERMGDLCGSVTALRKDVKVVHQAVCWVDGRDFVRRGFIGHGDILVEV